MNEGNITEMVKAIRGKKSADNENLLPAVVQSIEPFRLLVKDVEISKEIYINPALRFQAGEGISGLEELFIDHPGPEILFDFLKQFHCHFILQPGDTVLVLQSGSAFYVLEKVERAV